MRLAGAALRRRTRLSSNVERQVCGRASGTVLLLLRVGLGLAVGTVQGRLCCPQRSAECPVTRPPARKSQAGQQQSLAADRFRASPSAAPRSPDILSVIALSFLLSARHEFLFQRYGLLKAEAASLRPDSFPSRRTACEIEHHAGPHLMLDRFAAELSPVHPSLPSLLECIAGAWRALHRSAADAPPPPRPG